MAIFWSTLWVHEPFAVEQRARLIRDNFYGRTLGPRRTKKQLEAWHDETERDARVSLGLERRSDARPVDDKELDVETIPHADADIIPGFPAPEPNWSRARKIVYRGEHLRVFPSEFVELRASEVLRYLKEGGYTFVSESVAEEALQMEAVSGELKPVYEMAQLDGCTPAQARLVALGMDVSTEDADIPKIGWLRPSKQILDTFCYAHEQKED